MEILFSFSSSFCTIFLFFKGTDSDTHPKLVLSTGS